MTRSSIPKRFKTITSIDHFYFWLALPLTVLMAMVIASAQFIVSNYHRHPGDSVNVGIVLVLQTISLAWLVWLQRSLWRKPRPLALVVFGVLAICVFPITIPIEAITVLVLHMRHPRH